MIHVADNDIERFIKEDVPYIDLTTLVLGVGDQQGKMQYYSRDSAVICGTEEVLRIFDKLGVKATRHCPSGAVVGVGECFLEAEGRADNLHMAWKVARTSWNTARGSPPERDTWWMG